jgi:hypothetical protein
MASGYSTMFMAMALKRNNSGKIDAFELDQQAEKAAAKCFKKYNVDTFVQSYVGDARKTSAAMPSDYTIYFLDSLHTEDFARWFIDTHVMRAERAEAFFHMHDIMPPHARVRRWNRPPFDGDQFEEEPTQTWIQKAKRKAKHLVYPPNHSENRKVPIRVYPAEKPGDLQTFDGNWSTEAIWGNKIATLMKPEDNVFLYDIANLYPQLFPRKYDHLAVGRTDRYNIPMEWNETWWCKVTAFKEIYHRFIETKEKKT